MKYRTLAVPMPGELFLGLLASSAVAEPVSQGNLVLSDSCIRAMPSNTRVAGGYVTSASNGSREDRLVLAWSPSAGGVRAMSTGPATNQDHLSDHSGH